MKKLYFIILLAVFITSCETREDINMRRNTPPQIYVGKNNKDISVVELSDTIKKVGLSTYYFKSTDDSNLQLTHTLEMEFPDENSNIKDSVSVVINEQTNEIQVKTNLNDKHSTSYNFSIYVVATDIFGQTSKAKIFMTIIGNRAPVPQVTFNQISETEYEISAKDSYDLDGEKIQAYEYLINGTIIYSKSGYEGDYDDIANPNPGHAATGGTYIISTPLSSIKHNFQVENVNDFKVYIRVKDSRGLWSQWSLFSL